MCLVEELSGVSHLIFPKTLLRCNWLREGRALPRAHSELAAPGLERSVRLQVFSWAHFCPLPASAESIELTPEGLSFKHRTLVNRVVFLMRDEL